MKAVKRKSRKRSIILRISLAIFAIYVVVVLVELQMQLKEANQRNDELNAQIRTENARIEDLQDSLDNHERYQERSARDNWYMYPDEEVYIIAPGT